MSGQYEKEDGERDIVRANELVASIGDTAGTIQDNVRTFEKAIKPLKDKLDEDNAPLQWQRDDAMKELAVVMQRLIAHKVIKGKSVQLQSGGVAVRASTTLEVKDESLLRKKLRSLRVLLQAYVPNEPRFKLDKKKLGKFLKTRRGRELMPKLDGIVEFQDHERLTVTVPRVAEEIRLDLNPLRIDLPSS